VHVHWKTALRKQQVRRRIPLPYLQTQGSEVSPPIHARLVQQIIGHWISTECYCVCGRHAWRGVHPVQAVSYKSGHACIAAAMRDHHGCMGMIGLDLEPIIQAAHTNTPSMIRRNHV
jgi:hypothetical protein